MPPCARRRWVITDTFIKLLKRALWHRSITYRSFTADDSTYSHTLWLIECALVALSFVFYYGWMFENSRFVLFLSEYLVFVINIEIKNSSTETSSLSSNYLQEVFHIFVLLKRHVFCFVFFGENRARLLWGYLTVIARWSATLNISESCCKELLPPELHTLFDQIIGVCGVLGTFNITSELL